MNYNYLCFLDFETGSKVAYTTQPTQLTAVMIDPRKLTLVDGGVFNSYIEPILDTDKCKQFGIGEIEQEALDVTKISLETLKKAPPLKVVWANFSSFISQFNPKRDKWNAPILCGYNNDNFDNVIINRICGGNRLGEKEPYGFGPWDDVYHRNSLFHPIHCIDLMKLVWYWFENERDMKSMSFDTIRSYLGIDKDGAHNALIDSLQGAKLLIKFLRFSRKVYPTVNFKGSFAKENEEIKQILSGMRI